MQGTVTEICNIVLKFFGETAKDTGKALGFIKRCSKLTASLFAEVLILGCLSDMQVSLERICSLLS